jgi:hypothetical protein
MRIQLRGLARILLGVERISRYYLPWITRPGVDCVILVNNIEARFRPDDNQGPFVSSVQQYDANGSLVRRSHVSLASSVDTTEVPMEPARGGCGFATVDVSHLHSDLYVTLSHQGTYTATHGRHEFIERYPFRTRAVMAVIGALLGLAGRTIPAFRRYQYVYLGAESRSHLLILNLSNVTNRVRVVAWAGRRPAGRRLVTIPPMGARTLDVTEFGEADAQTTMVRRLRLEGNAWFNLYVLGAGSRDLAGPLSLMHVK